MTFAIAGDTNNAALTNLFGLTATGQNQVAETIIGRWMMDVWLADDLLDRVATSGIPEFKNGGWTAKFRKMIQATTNAYVIGKDLVYGGQQGFTDYTIELGYARYGTYTENFLQRAIQNRDVITIDQLLQHMGTSLANQLREDQWNDLMAGINTHLVATSVMATPKAQAGLFHKGVAKDDTAVGDWKPATGAMNIMMPFRSARISKKRKHYPKGIVPFALVSPETMDILCHMERNHFSVGSSKNEDAIMRGTANEMIVSGFEVIECDWITAATVNAKSGQHAIYFGAKEGLGFHRVLDHSDEVAIQSDFGKAYRKLTAYGFGFLDERLWGLDYVKI